MKKLFLFTVLVCSMLTQMTAQTINYGQDHAQSIEIHGDTIVAHTTVFKFTVTPTTVSTEGIRHWSHRVKVSEPSPGIILATDKYGAYLIVNMQSGQVTLYTACDYIVYKPVGGYATK